MTRAALDDLAIALGGAWENATAVPAPTSIDPSLTTADAYAVQDMIIAARIEGSRHRSGWKMGLTSAPAPTVPIVGTLLSDMVVTSGVELALGSLVAPMVEAEIVVRIGADIDRAVTVAELRAGPHEIGPGIEVIDYRSTDSRGPVDWIADNATVAYAVVDGFVAIADVEPSAIAATLSADGTVLASGDGHKVMGDPLHAVAWLSGHLADRGHRLERGHVVLTGSLTGHHRVPPGRRSVFVANFGSLGTVSTNFRP